MEELKEMTAERSIEIISKSIAQSRKDVTKTSASILMLWGVLVVATALVVGHLWKTTGSATWNCLWFAMTAVGVIAECVMSKRETRPQKSFLTDVIGCIWTSFAIFAIGFSALLLLAGVSGLSIGMPNADSTQNIVYILPLTAIIILLFGMAGTITGFVLRNWWIIICSAVSGVVGSLCSLLVSGAYGMLVLAGVAVINLIVPSILIRLKPCSNR